METAITGQRCGVLQQFATQHDNWQVHHWLPVFSTYESRCTKNTDMTESGGAAVNVVQAAASSSMTGFVEDQ